MEKIFSFFYAFLGSKRIKQMRRWAVQKAQDAALKAADSKKGRTLSKARGIGAEMSCRRRDGAGQSGSFASVKAREAANCSGKPGARRARKKAKQKCIRELQQLPIGPELIILLQGENYVENI